MKTEKTIVKEFIKNNGLVFGGFGSELNGHCTTLAGFICYITDEIYSEGEAIITSLKLSDDARTELFRVYEYAFNNNYRKFWDTPQAKELYTF